jgi:predicted NBD/HSP70 family sugar kinase
MDTSSIPGDAQPLVSTPALAPATQPHVLVIDIGGTNVKVLATMAETRRKYPSGQNLTPERMVTGVKTLVADWKFERISIGYPGPVVRGRIVMEPHNLGPGWVGYDFENAFGLPTKVINDAAMQALGSYESGKMLFLGLGTGLGSALVINGIVAPLELAHLPYRDRTYEDYVGLRGLEEWGKKKWRLYVADVVARLSLALQADEVVLGGGNVKELKELPPGCRAVSNSIAFAGGFRLWEEERATLLSEHRARSGKERGDGETRSGVEK